MERKRNGGEGKEGNRVVGREEKVRGRVTAKKEGEGKRGWKKGLVNMFNWGLGQFLWLESSLNLNFLTIYSKVSVAFKSVLNMVIFLK